MLCEKAYYPNGTGENHERVYCSDSRVTSFEGKCPLVYWCAISEKFENTTGMFECTYRKDGGNGENDNR